MRIPNSVAATLLGPFFLIASTACDPRSPAGLELELRADSIRGVMDLAGDTALITIPRSAQRGEPVLLNIITHGGAVGDTRGNPGCVRKGVTKVHQTASRVDIEVIDILYAPTCSLANAPLDHSVVLRFPNSGRVEVKIIGRSVPGNRLQIETRAIDVVQ